MHDRRRSRLTHAATVFSALIGGLFLARALRLVFAPTVLPPGEGSDMSILALFMPQLVLGAVAVASAVLLWRAARRSSRGPWADRQPHS